MTRPLRIALFRRILAVVIWVVLFCSLLLIMYSSFKEPRFNDQTHSHVPNALDPKSVRIVLDTFDAAARKVRAHAEIVVDRRGAVYRDDPKEKTESFENLVITSGPFVFEDLGEKLDSGGLYKAQSTLSIARLEERILKTSVAVADEHKAPLPLLVRDFPSPARQELTAIGDPRLYPFDRYVVAGDVLCQAFGYRHAASVSGISNEKVGAIRT